jgi:hypothetical protein
MGPDDVRRMIEGHQVATPDVIETMDLRSCTITHPKNAYIPEAYPTTVALFIREKGVILLDLDTIVSGRPSPGT